MPWPGGSIVMITGPSRSSAGMARRNHRRRRTLVATGLAAVVVATFLPLSVLTASASTSTTAPTPPAPPSAPPPATTAQPDHPILTAMPAADPPAKVLPAPPAVAAGSPGQELVERRTATSKTFVGAHPGEFRTEVYPAPVHYRDAQGQWADIKANWALRQAGAATTAPTASTCRWRTAPLTPPSDR